MDITKPLLIRRKDTNRVTTSSGEFLEYISWRQCRELAVGIGIHRCRFPKQGFLKSKDANEMIWLLKGRGSIIVNTGDRKLRYKLEEDSAMFIPKGTEFCFDPDPEMEILSSTGPAWFPKQQKGLDYRRKETGRMIL